MVLCPATGTKYTDSAEAGQPLLCGFPLAEFFLDRFAEHCPAVDDQSSKDEATAGQLNACHSLAKPSCGEQGNPDWLQYQDHHPMAVCRQALGESLKQETTGRTNDGTGYHPPDQYWRKVVQGRLPGFHDHGFNEGEHANGQQRNGREG